MHSNDALRGLWQVVQHDHQILSAATINVNVYNVCFVEILIDHLSKKQIPTCTLAVSALGSS